MHASARYGLALTIGTLAQVATMAFHPTGIDGTASLEALARQMQILVAVHALALLSVPVVVFGFVGVTRRIGWDRPAALFALIVYAFSAVAIMFAAIADGLINAALIPQTFGASESAQQSIKAALIFNFQLNQACAKVYVVGSSLAILFWSIAFIRLGAFERVAGGVGGCVALAGLAGLLSGHVRMSAHGFGLIVFLQSVWMVAIGVSMLRAGRNGKTQRKDVSPEGDPGNVRG
jgi:hypothetical protein